MLLIINLITTILILIILIFCLSKDLSDRGFRFSSPPPTTLPTKSSAHHPVALQELSPNTTEYKYSSFEKQVFFCPFHAKV